MNNRAHIDQALHDINELIATNSADAAYMNYKVLIEQIESTVYAEDLSLKAEVYASFAYFLFRVSEYDQCFKMLMKALHYGYSNDEIEKLLWEAFIEPNEHEFKAIYEANLQFLITNGYLHMPHPMGYHELPYWLLPTGADNIYYIYDRENKVIGEKITLYDYQNIPSLPAADAFSDYLLLENWNLNIILTCTNVIRRMNKKSYIVFSEIGKFLSCLQGALLDDSILSNVLIFDKLEGMNEYIARTNAFLPRNILNLINQENEQPKKILHAIHTHRLKKGNRNGDRILLSICIPSFNRGKRAYNNVLHLLQSHYDEEIEIILSNNGTQNETAPFYDKINEIDDARLTYFAFEENQGYALNCCKVCELAKGDFILLISDEDLVNFDVLGKILNQLNASKETLSLMKTSTTMFNKWSTATSKAGQDAMISFMLTSNYVSGMILNNTLLRQHKGIEYVHEHLHDNNVCYWYPHMFWELLLCQYGDVHSTELVLINEGAAEQSDEVVVTVDNSEIEIPYYRSIEGRLGQHEGFYRIFEDLEICKNDKELLRVMYLQLCSKTFALVNLTFDMNYKQTGADQTEFFKKAYDFCTSERFLTADIAATGGRDDIALIHRIMVNRMS
ncbi:glycosyltransferase [Paenibacillus spongiae]|uniref:Glycosyltransferase n=1 Tax=Paenibacillus spongiae TaxID=2909671 RepID=A0ABY5SCL2_9BACL|nr:glycosyltransferase [Paenibacillus spongiae]UVI30240.1 glycosyltransferase [Paenibacillus spongiae]